MSRKSTSVYLKLPISARSAPQLTVTARGNCVLSSLCGTFSASTPGRTLDVHLPSVPCLWIKGCTLAITSLVSPQPALWLIIVPIGRQIKANLKLNCNLEARVQMAECKQDMSMVNYAYKFDYIYEALVHNTRYFTEKSGDNLCVDESSWPYYGFGGPMGDYLQNKMHKHYKKSAPHTMQGCSEVHDIMSKFVLPYTGVGKLWKRPPHLTVDNFFNGDSILDWMGEHGLGMIGTVARNKLPKGKKCLPTKIYQEYHSVDS
eukprot:jgi/Psemu1/52925/gm1.52925_g